MLYLILGIASLGAATFLVAEVATLPARQRQDSVRRAARYGRLRFTARPTAERFRERALVPLMQKLARWVLKLNPKTTIESVTAKLLSAGLSRRISPTAFLAAKAVAGLCGLLVGFMLGGAIGGPAAGFFFAPALGFLGFIVPDVLVGGRAKRRKDRIAGELPDALDMLCVSVEAGLGLDGAIAKLTEHMAGPLADEFSLTLNETRIGESRADALRRMADRVDTPEMSAFVRAIIQTDQLGISLGRILRVQAADTRLRRQAAAEEKAMKAPIKMLFPTVVFIFPAMFIAILGPAFLNLSKLF
jgi:tight adherence protein C